MGICHLVEEASLGPGVTELATPVNLTRILPIELAGELLGENYRALTERFSLESTPCVIHFAGEPKATTLARALRYVYETLIEGLDDIESAASACEYFNGGGKPVPPDRILQIEPFPSTVGCDA